MIDPNYYSHWHQIIKRRIAWLFGQWVPKINDGIRVPVSTELYLICVQFPNMDIFLVDLYLFGSVAEK